MRRTYDTPQAGEWVRPVIDGYKMACCDCGLVHKMDFRVVMDEDDNHRVEFRVYRDNRATGQMRRHNNITLKQEFFDD